MYKWILSLDIQQEKKCKFLTVARKITWLKKNCHGGCHWGIVLPCTKYGKLILFHIQLCNLDWFYNGERHGHCISIKNVFLWRLFTSTRIVTKWHPWVLDVKFEPPRSITSRNTDHTWQSGPKLKLQRRNNVFYGLREAAEDDKISRNSWLFPRARLLANMNINLWKSFVIQISFPNL